MVFSWLCTGALFLYFFVLSICAILHQKDDSNVWNTGVREFPWFATRASLSSAPNTPVNSRFISKKSTPSFAAPKARRPPPIFVQQRAGLSSDYEIEHFPDPETLEQPLPPVPVPTAAAPPVMPNGLAFYPQHVQTTIMRHTTQKSDVVPVLSNTQTSTYHPLNSGLSTEPPPIRNWPRPMAQNERSRERRAAAAPSSENHQNMNHSTSRGSEVQRVSSKARGKARAPAGSESVARSGSIRQQGPTVEPTPPEADTPPSSYPSSRSRPTGPRSRRSSSSSSPKRRPPPLDLSKARPSETTRR